jgi:hypothetical protein
VPEKKDMEKISITEVLVRATSIDQMKTEKGRARMNQPYWLEGEGILVFDFIGAHTNKDILEAQIGRGLVWVQEKYGIIENK